MTVYGYARVSTDGQTLAAQEGELTRQARQDLRGEGFGCCNRPRRTRQGAAICLCVPTTDFTYLLVAQGPALSIDDAQFDKMVEVNLKSAFRLIRLVAPGMCDRGSGSIINIASISGIRPQFEGLMYSATKAALIMMTQCYALELGPRGVRVNAIAPGLIRTVLSEYYWKDESRREKHLDRQPIKHLGEPQEVAEVALMLASDRASYLTGQTIVVDGGATLRSI